MKRFVKNITLLILTLWIGFGPMVVPVVSMTQKTNTISPSMTISLRPINLLGADIVSAQNSQEQAINSGFRCTNPLDIFCGIAKFFVFIVTIIPNTIAAIIGSVTDLVMNYSIGSGFYSGISDISFTLWKIVRDFSNLLIIFALFLAAFSLILGGGDSDSGGMLSKLGSPKKIIVQAVIIAIFINFSFFFSRVMIDLGNVSGRIIYNQIGAEGATFASSIGLTTSGDDAGAFSDTKPITLVMLSNVQPQTLLGKSNAIPGFSTALIYLVIGVITLLIDLALIYLFSIMLFLFLGRMVTLLLLTILSPLAFASLPIPFLADSKYIGFQNWLKQTAGLAFLAPIFFFFIYISAFIGNISFPGLADSFIGLVSVIVIKLAMMLAVLFKGKSIAMDMSGSVGDLVNKGANMLSTFAIGAATGGTALLGRQTFGALGSKIANSTTGTGVLSRGIRNTGNALGAATFDVRNSTGKYGAMTGFNKATNALGGGTIDTGNTYQQKEGGYIAEGTLAEQYRNRQKEIEKKKIAEAEAIASSLKLNDQAVSNQKARKLEDKLGIAKKNLENKKITIENTAMGQVAPQSVTNDLKTKNTEAETKFRQTVTDYEQKDTDLNNRETAAKAILATTPNDVNAKTALDTIKKERKTLAKTEADYNKAKDSISKAGIAVTTANEHKNKNLREIQNEIAKIESESKDSKEKKDYDKAIEDAKKPEDEFKDAQRKYNENKKILDGLLKKQGNGTASQKELDRLDDLQTLDNKLSLDMDDKKVEHDKKQKELTKTKRVFMDKYENKQKALEGIIKDSLKAATKANQTELDSLQKVITDTNLELLDTKFASEQKNIAMQENYANRLENQQTSLVQVGGRGTGSAVSFGTPNNSVTQTLAVITNGAVFGNQVRGAGTTAANNLRGKLKTSTPKPSGDKPAGDKK